MIVFLANLLLALIWAMVNENLSGVGLLTGFVLGYFALWLSRAAGIRSGYFVKLPLALRFGAFYFWQLLLSNVRVAYDVLTPTHHMRPGVIAVKLEARTDFEIALLANLISLTPGTLALDLSEDRRTLYIHAMYIPEGGTEAFRKEIQHGLERRVLELLR